MFLQKKKAIQRFVKSSFKTKTHEKSGKLINFKLLGITSMLGNGKMGAPSQWESISINENKLINYFTNHKE